jgi:mannitol/fructose-specific phosphotransferase system IIA component
MLPHTRKVFKENVRHVFEIGIAILKFKMPVKFHSQTITNFVRTLIVQNTQGCTSALFKDRPISFLVYPED